MDLSGVPLDAVLPDLRLEGTADIEADVVMEETGPRGPLSLHAKEGTLEHPSLPLAIPYEQIEGELEFGGENAVEISKLDIQSPMGTGRILGRVGQAPNPANAALDLEVDVQAAESIRAVFQGQGVKLGADGTVGPPDHRHRRAAAGAIGMDQLQKVFKTLADPTRVRVLALLEREELAVQELMDVLGMAQSRVSRHLAILREAGLLADRRDGTYVFYRLDLPTEGPWRDTWKLVRGELSEDPTHQRDLAALAEVMESRAARTRTFFDSVGPEWDALRKVFHDDTLRARAVSRLVPPGLLVADVGTGTGILAGELAELGLRVVAVDHSQRMLDAARANWSGKASRGWSCAAAKPVSSRWRTPRSTPRSPT